ncbi:MAG: cupin domain-containing protein [Prevotellaceae bacterium]|jgi:quercetin dioxygenase-like cupin family protein|nr:cupin domain-containing protein [Prevotellaceae bacterium]
MENKSNTFILGEHAAWEPAGDGVRRQVMGYGEQLMLVQVEFQKGAVGARHEHPHAQASYVASGKFEVQVGEEKKTLSGGDGFFVEPNVPHGVFCLEAGVLIDTFSPMRLDFVGR